MNYQDIVRAWLTSGTLPAEQKRAVALIASGTATDAQLAPLGAEFVAGIKAHLPHEVRASGERVAESKENVITWKFSDDKPDRMGDIIRQDGWKLDNYKRNPVVLWGHAHGLEAHADEPIGRTIDLRIEKGALVGDILFAVDESERAARIYALAKKGFVQAGSVGFRPLKTQHVQDEAERSKLGLGRFGVIFEETELLEFSLCAIPANPNALQQALKSGALAQADYEMIGTSRTERDWENYIRKHAKQEVLVPIQPLPPGPMEEDLRHAVRTLSDSLAAHTELASAVRCLSQSLSAQAELATAVGGLSTSLSAHASAHGALARAITDLGGCIQTLRAFPAPASASPAKATSATQRKVMDLIEAIKKGDY